MSSWWRIPWRGQIQAPDTVLMGNELLTLTTHIVRLKGPYILLLSFVWCIMYTCTRIIIHTHTHAYNYNIYIYIMCVCVRIYIYIYIYINAHLHMHKYICTCTCINTQTHIHIIYVYIIYTYTYIYAYINAYEWQTLLQVFIDMFCYTKVVADETRN